MNPIDAFEGFERYIGTIGMWIAGDEVARIQDGRGLLLSVQFGTIWITQAGSVKDVFVGPGGSFLIDRDGLTLVSLGGYEPAAAITLMPSIGLGPTFAQRLGAALSRRSKALVSLGQRARVFAKVFSAGLPARQQPDGFNRIGFIREQCKHAAS